MVRRVKVGAWCGEGSKSGGVTRGNVLVKVWLRMVLRHVVQEVDVCERPVREFLCVWPNLEFVMVILIYMLKNWKDHIRTSIWTTCS